MKTVSDKVHSSTKTVHKYLHMNRVRVRRRGRPSNPDTDPVARLHRR